MLTGFITQDRGGLALVQVLAEGCRQTRARSAEEVRVGRPGGHVLLRKSRDGSAGEQEPRDLPPAAGLCGAVLGQRGGRSVGPGAGRRRSGSLKEAEVLSSSATREGAASGCCGHPSRVWDTSLQGLLGPRVGQHTNTLSHCATRAPWHKLSPRVYLCHSPIEEAQKGFAACPRLRSSVQGQGSKAHHGPRPSVKTSRAWRQPPALAWPQ